MSSKKRIESIVADAQEKSAALISALPVGRIKHRKNAERVVAVCGDLVSAKPVREPRTPLVTELGQSRYGDFPSEQSLLNRYAAILRVWREAFRQVVDISAPTPAKGANAWAIAQEDLAPLDHGTKSRIQLLLAVLRETKGENDRLKQLVRGSVPAPGDTSLTSQAADVTRARAIRDVGRWLVSLQNGAGPLEVNAVGVRISRRAMPGQIVISAEVLEALRLLCLAPDQPKPSSPMLHQSLGLLTDR